MKMSTSDYDMLGVRHEFVPRVSDTRGDKPCILQHLSTQGLH